MNQLSFVKKHVQIILQDGIFLLNACDSFCLKLWQLHQSQAQMQYCKLYKCFCIFLEDMWLV